MDTHSQAGGQVQRQQAGKPPKMQLKASSRLT